MPANETLNLKITFDEKGAVKAVKNVDKAVDKSSKQIKKSSEDSKSSIDKIKGAYVLLAGVIVGVVGAAFKKIVTLAKDFEEANAKFGTVFRNNSKEANTMRKELVNSYGLSTLAATKMMSSIQDFLVPMGLARDEATKLSGKVSILARDLGSFNDEPTEDVLNAVKSALSGISMPMKRFGVDVSEAGLKQQLLNEGLDGNVRALSRAEKAQLIYRKIVADSGDAMGDFKRTSDSFANTLVSIGSIAEDVQLLVGQQLMNAIAPTVREFGKFIKSEKGIMAISKAIQTLTLAVSLGWQVVIKPVFMAFRGLIKNIIIGVKGIVKAYETLTDSNATMKDRLIALKEIGKSSFADLKDNYTDLADSMKAGAKDISKKTIALFTKSKKAQIKGMDEININEKELETQRLERLEAEKQAKMMTAEELKEFQKLIDEEREITEEEQYQKKIERLLAYKENFILTQTEIDSIDATIKQMQEDRENKLNQKRKENMNKAISYAQQMTGSLNSIGNSRMQIERYRLAKMNKNREKYSDDDFKRQKDKMRKIAKQNKSLRIATAIIDSAAAVIKTMAGTPYPFNIPLAAAQAIAGGFQVAMIKNEPIPEFAKGGTVGGRGGVDSQLVRATPGETMFNPAQGRNLFNNLEAAGLLKDNAGSVVNNTSRVDKRMTMDFAGANFNLPNVTNPQDFMEEMQEIGESMGLDIFRR